MDNSTINIEKAARKAPRDNLNYVLSPLEEDILTVLQVRSAYGFMISKAITAASYGARKISVGSLYPSLRRLEQKGLVTSYWDTNETPEEERSGARRRYYEITDDGSKILSENQAIRQNLLKWQPV